MSKKFLQIENLSKTFDPKQPPALDAITATFSDKQIIGIVGPDGSGKTTLIRLLAGLLTPTSGSIFIDGHDVMGESETIHQMIGYMPQQFGLYEDLSVEQNLNLYADLQGIIGADRERQFERLLNFSGLKSFTKRLAKHLSGGMKQKLGLSCALMRRPRLLLLDEPSVGVDPISRRELWKMIEELLAEGITVVWSTAYLDEAEKCDQALLLNKGNLLFCGSPLALTSRLQQRTYQIQSISTDRRKVLVNALKDPHVMDATIQGSAVRIVVKDRQQCPDLQRMQAGDGAKLVSIPPRFEDAFIDILGGGPGGISRLAENMEMVKTTREMAIEAENLTKQFGSFTAVDDISFSVKRGEIFGLLGPNGAGKSTTFKMLCGLLKPTHGRCHVNGLSLQAAPSKARGQIGYMAQKFSLYGNMNPQQNLRFFSGIYPVVDREKMIKEMIDVFELQPFLNIPSSTLPLGFQRRLSLACAVMHEPRILFLDEPTSGVDPVTRRDFWNHINGMVEKGITVMVTTHFMDEAEYCDRIALIANGKLKVVGTPDELKDKVRSPTLPEPTLEDVFITL